MNEERGRRVGALRGLMLAIALGASMALAQQSNNVESLRLALDRQNQALLAGYGKAIEGTLVEIKKKGDLDAYLVVEAEKKRFETEKSVPVPAGAKESFRPAAETYHRALCDVLRKYVAALDRLIRQSVQQEKIEEAKALRAEKDRAAFMLADAETKLPDTGADKEEAPAGETDPEGKPVRLGAVMTTNEMMSVFSFPNDTWRIENKAMTGKIGPFSPVWLKKPLSTRSFDFSFSIMARWYHMIKIQINDVGYGYSRGHWGNTASALFEGADWQKKEGRVEKPEEWHKLRATLASDTLTFYYDGKSVGSFKVNLAGKPKPKVVVGFDSYECPCSVKDVVLKVKD